MESLINNELQIYRGKDFIIKEGIIISQPTLDEICNYGEREYFQLIHTFTSTPADLKWQLDESGIDYTQISDFELFYHMTYQMFTKEMTSIIFGDLDWSKFQRCSQAQDDTEKLILYHPDDNIVVDEFTYLLITEVLRKIHGLKRNNQLPGNETTKRILIEDAKEEYLANKNREYRSQLKNLISAMINSEGFKYNHSEVWNMKINAFMDSVQRISKIQNANLLLQSGYSGYGISLKDVDKQQLNWLGDLE